MEITHNRRLHKALRHANVNPYYPEGQTIMPSLLYKHAYRIKIHYGMKVYGSQLRGFKRNEGVYTITIILLLTWHAVLTLYLCWHNAALQNAQGGTTYMLQSYANTMKTAYGLKRLIATIVTHAWALFLSHDTLSLLRMGLCHQTGF